MPKPVAAASTSKKAAKKKFGGSSSENESSDDGSESDDYNPAGKPKQPLPKVAGGGRTSSIAKPLPAVGAKSLPKVGAKPLPPPVKKSAAADRTKSTLKAFGGDDNSDSNADFKPKAPVSKPTGKRPTMAFMESDSD